MFIFLLLSVYLVAMWVVLKQIKCKNTNMVYCVFAFIALALIMGLRAWDIGGVDTARFFLPQFNRICRYSMNEVINAFGEKDGLFYILSKLFSYISHDFQVYLFTIAAISVAAFCWFVSKNSDNPLMSVIVYLALGYYGTGFQLLRHIVAVSVLLWSYEYLKKRKFIPFVLLVILASCFHITALVFILAYPLYSLKVGLIQWFVLGGAIVVAVFFEGIVFSVLKAVLLGNSRFNHYFDVGRDITLSIAGFLILLVVYLASFFLIPKADKNTPEIRGLFNLSMLSTVMMLMVVFIGEFHRVSMFFGIYNTILLPKACTLYKGRGKSIVYIAIGGVLLAYFLIFQLENQMLIDYEFFW